VSDKVASLIEPLVELKTAREAAKVWFEERNKVDSQPVRLGGATSNAGREAGDAASSPRRVRRCHGPAEAAAMMVPSITVITEGRPICE
jgi:hypothetical protein